MDLQLIAVPVPGLLAWIWVWMGFLDPDIRPDHRVFDEGLHHGPDSAYALFGTFVLVVWLARSGTTPDVVGAFATGVLGRLGGAFIAEFRKT